MVDLQFFNIYRSHHPLPLPLPFSLPSPIPPALGRFNELPVQWKTHLFLSWRVLMDDYMHALQHLLAFTLSLLSLFRWFIVFGVFFYATCLMFETFRMLSHSMWWVCSVFLFCRMCSVRSLCFLFRVLNVFSLLSLYYNKIVYRSELERRGWRFFPRSTSHLDKYKYNFPDNYSVQHVSLRIRLQCCREGTYLGACKL